MKIKYDDQEIEYDGSKSVLDCLLEAGYDIPNSCKSGVCFSCVVQASQGNPGEEAQSGLKPSQQEQGFFKSCVCYPTEDLTITSGSQEETFKAVVSEKTMLNERTLLLRITSESNFEYKSGQFLNLIRPADGLMRSYSIASIPSEEFLELHIRCYDDGKMSSWLKSEVEAGTELEFSGPLGDCFYTEGKEEDDLLLAGIGTGMAPLYGIVRDALNRGHKGKITIIQGAMTEDGLYYVDQFQKVANDFENCTYIPSTVDGSGDYTEGKIDDVVKANFPDLKGHRVYLCGSPNTVNRLKRYSFLAGASMGDIYSDPFTVADS